MGGMDDSSSQLILEPPRIRMPAFADGIWLNSPTAYSKEKLFGRVSLIDFWDFTCINCVRTLPYLKLWQ